MEIRRFILDLKPDGSVKWAEVSDTENDRDKLSEIKRWAVKQKKDAKAVVDRADNVAVRFYNWGWLDAMKSLESIIE